MQYLSCTKHADACQLLIVCYHYWTSRLDFIVASSLTVLAFLPIVHQGTSLEMLPHYAQQPEYALAANENILGAELWMHP